MSEATRDAAFDARRHLRIGWWSLVLFLGFGIVLEALHGFKVGAYLDLSNATRRHMWTLSHAHGTLLGLMNIAFALSVKLFCQGGEAWLRPAGLCLLGATVLLPGGFFLGGAVIYAGDPGLGVLLVPVGALLLLVATVATARRI